MSLLPQLIRAIWTKKEPDSVPEGSVRFGPILIPPDFLNHFFLFGATGAGKTTMLRLMLQDIVPYIGQNEDWRLPIPNGTR